MMDGIKPPLAANRVKPPLMVLLERLDALRVALLVLLVLLVLLPPIFGRTSNPLTPRTSLPAEADD